MIDELLIYAVTGNTTEFNDPANIGLVISIDNLDVIKLLCLKNIAHNYSAFSESVCFETEEQGTSLSCMVEQ
ncbi:hypothetical protein THF1A12_40250 [Vibrio jasicida]|uniref:Uncharacterized protein n=1 Tax=Vibrio jasicida TaxID=766224 RepID=A0AAU9QRE9_9VIBR|nr:hypothetical protein THF1A12_40250 [Vibrio jasicida]